MQNFMYSRMSNNNIDASTQCKRHDYIWFFSYLMPAWTFENWWSRFGHKITLLTTNNKKPIFKRNASPVKIFTFLIRLFEFAENIFSSYDLNHKKVVNLYKRKWTIKYKLGKPAHLWGPPRGIGISVRHSFSNALPSLTAILQCSNPGVWRFSLLPPITWSRPLHSWVAGEYLKILMLQYFIYLS